MRRWLLPLLCLLAAPLTCGAAANGTILRTEPWPALPAYETLDDFGRSYFRREIWEEARAQTGFIAERIVYASDGLEVPGVIYRPRVTPATPRPVIVYCRGGSGDFGRLETLNLPDFYLWAKAGFTVVASDLRWHGETARLDQWGGEELNDILNLLPLLRRLPGVDTSRLYLVGLSRGGMMTFLALRRGFTAKAAVVMAAVTDVAALARDRSADFVGRSADYDGWAALWPDFANQREKHFRARSAIHWANEINAPVLLLHARNDPKVPVTDALQMAAALQAAKKPYSLHIFERDGHSLPLHRAERNQLIFDWLNQHP